MSSDAHSGSEAIYRVCMLLIMFAWSPGVFAQGFLEDRASLYETIGSSDVYRGISRNERSVAIQVGAKIQFDHISFGASVHDAQFSSSQGKRSDETEVNYYLAYSQAVNEQLGWQLQFSTYTFPGSSNAFFEYDYNELSLTLELPAGLTWSFGASDTSLSFAEGITYSEMTWRRSLPEGFELSAGLGGVRSLSGERNGYAYWDIGVSRLVKSVAVDIRYHYSPYDENWFGRSPANGSWVLSLTKGWSY